MYEADRNPLADTESAQNAGGLVQDLYNRFGKKYASQLELERELRYWKHYANVYEDSYGPLKRKHHNKAWFFDISDEELQDKPAIAREAALRTDDPEYLARRVQQYKQSEESFKRGVEIMEAVQREVAAPKAGPSEYDLDGIYRVQPMEVDEAKFAHPGHADMHWTSPWDTIHPQVIEDKNPRKPDAAVGGVIGQILGQVNQSSQRNIWGRAIDDHQSTYYDSPSGLTWAQMCFGYSTPGATGKSGTRSMNAGAVAGPSMPFGTMNGPAQPTLNLAPITPPTSTDAPPPLPPPAEPAAAANQDPPPPAPAPGV